MQVSAGNLPTSSPTIDHFCDRYSNFLLDQCIMGSVTNANDYQLSSIP